MTQELVRELFEYHEDGYLIWKVDRAFNPVKGKKAGNRDRRGYCYISINGRHHAAYRLIFLWHFGYLPPMIDHISRDQTDDRIHNLRAATATQNGCNQKSHTGSSSKWKGVSYHKAKGNWRAYISYNKQVTYLGSFENEEDAAMAYNEAAMELHGEFAVLNESPLNFFLDS